MSLKRLAAPAVALIAGMAASSSSFALPLATTPRAVSEDFVSAQFNQTAAPASAQSSFPIANGAQAEKAVVAAAEDTASETSLFKAPRKRLADFAMKLRDIRYVRGGHEPTTGFDCSGFVHYVFRETFGLVLPYDAPSQFRDGKYVARNQMQTGDLVFFHEGKRISHVGIYLDDGRFIHSPRPGKRVRVDSIDSTYWAKRFAGAKRPDVLS